MPEDDRFALMIPECFAQLISAHAVWYFTGNVKLVVDFEKHAVFHNLRRCTCLQTRTCCLVHRCL